MEVTKIIVVKSILRLKWDLLIIRASYLLIILILNQTKLNTALL